ncbi:MAG TPA: hypothetical protein VI544_00245, partial [Candidatus Nanoarchaeia archaeon]|nr:hypothetical protein [Candidatus Nanoarchaeia archaeon]
MVYKRYAKKNGKVYGPYFYESYREDGVVKKVYIGQKPASNLVVPRKNFAFLSLLIFAIIALIFLAGFMSFKHTGIVTLEAQPIYNFGEILTGQVNLNIESGDSIQKNTQIKLTL